MLKYLCFWLLLFAVTGCGTIVSPTIIPSPTAITGDAARGDDIFHHGVNEAPPCSTCHQVVSGAFGFSLGPNLAGVAERAASRIAGLSAEAYLHQSILEPHAYVVSGYRDIMYPDFALHLSEQEVADLIAYLVTLR